MLDGLVFCCAAVLTGCMIGQAAFAVVFAWRLLRWRPAEPSDVDLPRAVVLVGLKGADPFLVESLRRLMSQDYPAYEVHICVDSRDDPAWSAVQEAIDACQADHVRVEAYEPNPEHGQVNCTVSKQVQLLRKLDNSFEVLASVDGDMMPHADWLKTLVTPLVTDAKIGATFGNRWFMPAEGRWGSLVRYAWNVAAGKRSQPSNRMTGPS